MYIGKYSDGHTYAFREKPVSLTFEFEVGRVAMMGRYGLKKALDYRLIAEELAKHLLANGFINQSEPLRMPDRDSVQFRFTVYAMRVENPLP